MTIATRGSVRSLELSILPKLGAPILLANTYHLWLKPGLQLIRNAGGLHRFIGWNLPILTDSGGFQVFSLARLRTVTDRSVIFRDDQSGARHVLTPERSIEIQATLGSDIAMAFDECPAFGGSKAVVRRATDRTTAWAKRCLHVKRAPGQLLFGIVQGGTFLDLRVAHARTLRAMQFDGFAIGGLAVGEPPKMMLKTLDAVVPELPGSKPRYLMGVGPPDQIVDAVRRGADMFDCVLPTRNARHELLYVRKPNVRVSDSRAFWTTLKIARAGFANDLSPIDRMCDCPTCRTTTRAYLRHLFATRDPLASRLATIHNVRFYQRLMEDIRAEILAGRL